jgi:ketosteroid isomerase-like protein
MAAAANRAVMGPSQERMSMSNAQTVQGIYAAFGRGDIPAILERLAPDVEWEYGTTGHGVPWLQPRRGREQVVGFFQALAELLEFKRFAPTAVIEGPGIVVALIDLEAVVKATGRSFAETDEAHIWRFDDAGRVRRFKHGVDTHQHVLAYRG